MTYRWMAVLCVAALAAAARGDEVDGLVKQLAPPARFADHKPAWSVKKQVFTFEHYQRQTQEPFWLIMDGDRHVAIMPLEGFHSGTIYVQDFRPGQAPQKLNMPTERWHIDTAIGSELRTNNFIPEAYGATDASYQWKVCNDGTLLLTRQFKGSSKFNRWAHRTKEEVKVDAVNTIVFRVDPVLGYVVDATFDVWTDPPPKTYEYTSAATSGRYGLWPGDAACYRLAITPPGQEGFIGYATNHGASRQHGSNTACRDKGFVSFLNDQTGWSPTWTIDGSDAKLVVCGAHTDNDFISSWPAKPETREDGLKHFVLRHRMLALPPELTKHVWDNMKLLHQGEKKFMMRLGVREDFEDQPLPIDQRWRGMPWGGEIVEGTARSGNKSLKFTGRCGHGDPQLVLRPNTQYRIEAWMKVVAWTAQERAAAEAKAKADIEKQRQKKPDTPAFAGLPEPEAYILGCYYEWTPHSNQWIGEPLKSQVLTPSDQWQKVTIDFVTPKWGPFIDVAFHGVSCTVYLDDFRFGIVEGLPK